MMGGMFTVEGMTCKSCEKTINERLSALKGVSSVRASQASGSVSVNYDPAVVKETDLVGAIEEAGYNVRKKPINKNMQTFRVLGLMTILLALYLVLNHLGVFTFVPEVTAGMSYIMLFAVGVLTSFHCIAMCGGINLAITGSRPESGTKTRSKSIGFIKVSPGLAYNVGRVISYTLIGGLAGALGSMFSFSDTARNTIVVIAGFFMILMGIKMLGIFQRLPNIHIPIPKYIRRLSSRVRGSSPLVVGLFNGLMPCGPLQTMQIYALGTASFITGALSMFFFSIGTVPMMLGLSLIAGSLSKKRNAMLRYASAVLVIFLGLQMAGRVLSPASLPVASWLQSRSSTSVSATAIIGDEYQEVRSEFPGGRYTPVIVQVGIPVRWVITAAENEINGCNNRFQIDGYEGQVSLRPGETVVEFTPGETGVIRYACWMNMIVSTITVVDDLDDLEDTLADQDTQPYNGNNISRSEGLAAGQSDQALPECCCCVE